MFDDHAIDARSIDGLDELFDELGRHCHSSAIITVSAPTGETFEFDMQRDGDHITYGYERGHAAFIKARTLRIIAEGGVVGVTIRSFLDETHPKTELPYKELRAYHTRLNGDYIEFDPLPAEAVFEAYTTDASTGDPLAPEVEAIYCGPDERIRGEDR